MTNREVSISSRRAKRILAVTAWTTLTWVGVGYVSEIPSVNAWIASETLTAGGRIVEGVLLTVAAVTLIGLWAAAVWYALVGTPTRSARKRILVTVLIAGNIAAAFIYYFGYVLWRPTLSPRAAPSANGGVA